MLVLYVIRGVGRLVTSCYIVASEFCGQTVGGICSHCDVALVVSVPHSLTDVSFCGVVIGLVEFQIAETVSLELGVSGLQCLAIAPPS
jgi:hypothetical protein